MALAVTAIGFFASLKFYRDAVGMQTKTDHLLVKVEERSLQIQSQVGGMFDKTLTAALGQAGAAQNQRAQALDRQAASPPSAGDASSSARSAAPVSPMQQLTLSILDFYSFRGMYVSNISDPDTRAVFMLGGGNGFYLLDGPKGRTFLGFFSEREPVEVVALCRRLIGSLNLAHDRVAGRNDPGSQAAARELGLISIEVIVGDNSSPQKVLRKIQQYQPSTWIIPVSVLGTADVEEALAREYREMRPE